MDKKAVGLVGALTGLATIGVSQAAITPASDAAGAYRASSYADLLAPIPNALDVLHADDAARAHSTPANSAHPIRTVQYYYYGSPYYYSPYYDQPPVYTYTPYSYPYYYRYRHHYHHHHHHHHHHFYRWR